MARLVDDWIEGYVKLLEEQEPPRLFKVWAAISTVAACLQRKCYHVWEMDTRIYPNMYIVLVGPPSSRKGTAMRPARHLLDSVGVTLSADAITREALIKALDKSGLPLDRGDDFMHSSLTIFSEEFTVFLGYKNQSMIDVLVTWFDCQNKWDYETKNSGTNYINGVWVNIIGATTPTALREALPDLTIGGGFASRIIFVYGKGREKVNPYPIMTDAERKLQADLLVDLESIRMLQGEFRMTKEFIDLHHEWYTKSAKNPKFRSEYLLAYNDRRSLHLRKLCMIVSAARSDSMILDAAVFQRARALLDEAENEMENVFSGRGSHPHAAIISEILKKLKTEGKISRKDILRDYMNHMTPDDAQKIMTGISQAGLATIKIVDGEPVLIGRK